MRAETLQALADAADALARLARSLVTEQASPPSALLPVRDAAALAGTSVRVVREAIREGALAAFGRQRDRAVRRDDLERWVQSRRVAAVAGPDDRDIERRIARLSKARRPTRTSDRPAAAGMA